ncbi:hypothetical protein NCH01_03280 [Neoasaia chiangmaiensis]|uniref:Uncharacterized protein n=1 Tax=Neoasaia chiangmaiensis TaxID=320497 RepID=A0A1U9KST8_9PROT|nr:biliverdin-producing heme oxygenase [Neoasaia chiangmaiensis]AQS88904.1 hypothetical protein A0U93_14350 [Neoasaia chiangmaiensis]GEN13897.1 hypothetical protein NCH01_03280 [Neoasaia chiangmaiensis]
MTASISPGAEQLAILRRAMRGVHEQTDRKFSVFDLRKSADYAAFLQAHSRVLTWIEPALLAAPNLPEWLPRRDFIESDLNELGIALPQKIDAAMPQEDGALLGAVYVLEGSRLGGRWLAEQVPVDMPRRYLGAAHPQGSWARFLRALEEAFEKHPEYGPGALAGAHAVFAAFDRAAGG